VTGKTVVLSVGVTDDGGATAVKIRWATVGQVPARVIFSNNGSTTKTTTATFTTPGEYRFEAMAIDAQGATASAQSATVSVVATHVANAVEPAGVWINPGSTMAFRAVALDQFAQACAIQPAGFTWTVSGTGVGGNNVGGTTGIVTAKTTGSGQFTVTAVANGKSGSTVFNLGAKSPVAFPGQVQVVSGQAATVSLRALDANLDPLSWHVVAPPGFGSITGSGSDVTYRSQPGYIGPDRMTFKVNDGRADSNTAEVQLLVSDAAPPGSPGTVSPLVRTPPFDAGRWVADPAYQTAYLAGVEPGRVWQSLQPGPGITAIRASTATRFAITSAGSVALTVQAIPNAPVTFLALGEVGFGAARSKCVTIKASTTGVASVTCYGMGAANVRVPVIAASPMLSGLVRMLVEVGG
jgi:hypothetical protein